MSEDKCCYQCTERHYNCHSECEKYNRFLEATRKRNKELAEERRYVSSSIRRTIGAAIRKGKYRR